MKKVLLIVFSFLLVYMFLEIKNTYSLFETNGTVDVSSDLANWYIMVNNNNINDLVAEKNTATLGNIVWNDQAHVVDEKAAPGSSGKFNLVIDGADTQVSFVYEITIDLSFLNNDEIQIDYVKELNNYNLVRTGKNTYSSVITLEEIKNNVTHNIELGLIWNNNEKNNKVDYELGSQGNEEINIPIIISFFQYTGVEELVPYVKDGEDDENLG